MMANLTADISGMSGVLQQAIRHVRSEVALALYETLQHETDGRVVTRLNEIVAKLDGTLAATEATIVAKEAPYINEPRRVKAEADSGA